ncbi:hypothetical protein CASFOL_022214 [Castilleja foliolosa]|uniref:Ubiquitin-like protease family profile domain-containing protein n=1 Tax=Castilleja foliolosa TaxID=1961234 RepID=A0ABD3CXZ2_9LAMI
MTTEKMTKQYARKKDLKADKGAGNTKVVFNQMMQIRLLESVCQPICTQQPVSCDTVLHACDGIDKSGPVPTNKNANGGTVNIIRAQSRKSSQAAEKLVIGQSIEADEAFVNPPNKRAALGKNVVEGAHQKESGQVSSKGKSDAPQRKQLAVGNQGEKRKKVVFEKGECSTKKRKASTKTDSGMPHLLTQNKSYTLIQAFKGMSIEQRITVQSMGFEDLLEMNVAETPSTLSYWLLEAFDPRSCAVKLDHGRWLHVEDEDVTNVLGIPNGTSLFKRKAKNIPNPIVIDFRAFFDGDTNITSERLANKMLTQDATSDPDSAKELNWGQYMKKCLSETVRHWHDNKHLPFTGPLLFLLWFIRGSKTNQREFVEFADAGGSKTDCRTGDSNKVSEPVDKVKHGKNTLTNKLNKRAGVNTRMITRNDAERKRSAHTISPYQERAIKGGDGLDKVQKELCYWIMNDEEINSETHVYSADNIDLPRSDILTLGEGLYVSVGIIDVWSKILNNKENLRSPSSPKRFFANTGVTTRTIVYQEKDRDNEQCEKVFIDNLTQALEGSIFKPAEIDLFIFPIYQADHIYIICVNIKGGRVDIVDNSLSMQNMPLRQKYGTIPAMLAKYLVTFLQNIGQKTKAKKLLESMLYRVEMPWRNDSNKVDCAIYAMRHMECYFGQPPKEWECGITLGCSMRLMKSFRAKYCAAFLAAPQNSLHQHNLTEAAKYCKAKKVKLHQIGVDDVLSNLLTRTLPKLN